MCGGIFQILEFIMRKFLDGIAFFLQLKIVKIKLFPAFGQFFNVLIQFLGLIGLFFFCGNNFVKKTGKIFNCFKTVRG